MNKSTILAAAAAAGLALLVGIGAGVALASVRMQDELDAQSNAVREQQEELQRAEALADKQASELEILQAANSRLEDDLADLRSDLASRPEPTAPEAAEEDSLEEVFSAAFDAPAPEAPERIGAPGREWGRDRDETDEERAEREARRQEAMENARTRMSEFMDNAITNADTPQERERMVALRDNMAYMGDLMENYRDLESDAERELYREDMRQTRQNIGEILNQQRDDMMADLASDFGITDPEQQQQFLSALENTQRDPLYNGPWAAMAGGFGPGGRGGFGGPGGFGGGRGR